MPRLNPTAPKRTKNPTAHKSGWSVAEWAADTSLSRSTVFNLLKEGCVRSVKFGGRTIILTPPADFLAALAAEAA
ncbi:hypothetical protein [Niveispirillum sp. KHB5.9]|uniref:hypothetical protein n=1 Tax=Niveispirillum sp. KHB5.9 TaxID=3400269 RepID=UPI003A85E45A